MTDTATLAGDRPVRRDAELRADIQSWPRDRVEAWHYLLHEIAAHGRGAQALHHDAALGDLLMRLAELSNVAEEEIQRQMEPMTIPLPKGAKP